MLALVSLLGKQVSHEECCDRAGLRVFAIDMAVAHHLSLYLPDAMKP
jgi:hypothetical protein